MDEGMNTAVCDKHLLWSSSYAKHYLCTPLQRQWAWASEGYFQGRNN